MKKIHFLASKDLIVYYSLLPILKNITRLRDLGYNCKIFYNITEELLNCDILCLFSKPTINLLKENHTIIFKESGSVCTFIKKAKKYVEKVLWFDSSDSSTVTHFELLPFIDIYLKKQILKNLKDYNLKYYGGRIFTDFYHRKNNIRDKKEFIQFYPLSARYHHKIKLSWNIGLGNVFNAFVGWRKILHNIFPNFTSNYNKINFTPANSNKEIDIFLRGSTNFSRETINFHRTQIFKKLIRYSRKRDIISVIGKYISEYSKKSLEYKFLLKALGQLSNKNYRKMFQNAKISISPFGWGELGARDYETIINGAVLIKPDMSHMITWPDIFIPNFSYIPLSWDLSNLDEICDKLLSDNELRIKIVQNSQIEYQNSISENGMENFCNWFLKQIKEKI